MPTQKAPTRIFIALGVWAALATAKTTDVSLAKTDSAGAAADAADAANITYTPKNPTIAFFWSTVNDSNFNIPQCEPFRMNMVNNSGQVPVAPFYFTAAAIGYQPEVMNVPVGVGRWFSWLADFGVGTQMTLAITDSGGQSGGSIDDYYIGAGASNCTLRAASTAALNVTYNPTDNPCDEIDLTIHSGVGPFTVSFLAGGIGLYANATNVNSTTPRITNPVAAGNGFNMFVTDSTGNTSIVSPTMTSKRGLAGCSTPTPTATPAPVKKSGLSLGGVIGGVLAGVFAALAVLAIGLFLLRRRRAREAEEALARELEGSSEYKQDGAVPLVTPFVLPSKGPGGGGHGGGEGSGSNSSPTSYVNPYQPNEDATTGGYGSRDSAYDSPVDSRRGSDYGYPSYPPPGGSLRPREESAYSAAQASAGGFHSPHSPYGGLPDQGYGYDHGPTSATELAPGQVEYAEALGAPYPGYTPGLPHGLPGHEGYEEEDGTVDGLAHPASFNYR